MFYDPAHHILQTIRARSNAQDHVGQFLLRVFQFDIIESKKYQHGVHTNALLPSTNAWLEIRP